jgi:hypothetical protein
VRTRNISAYDKLLAPIYAVLYSRASSLSSFIQVGFALSDNTLQLLLTHRSEHVVCWHFELFSNASGSPRAAARHSLSEPAQSRCDRRFPVATRAYRHFDVTTVAPSSVKLRRIGLPQWKDIRTPRFLSYVICVRNFGPEPFASSVTMSPAVP